MGIGFSARSPTLAAFKKKKRQFKRLLGNSHHIPCWVSGKMLLWGGHFRQLGSCGFTSCSNYIQVGECFGSNMVTEVISKVFILVSWGNIPPDPPSPAYPHLAVHSSPQWPYQSKIATWLQIGNSPMYYPEVMLLHLRKLTKIFGNAIF